MREHCLRRGGREDFGARRSEGSGFREDRKEGDGGEWMEGGGELYDVSDVVGSRELASMGSG
eukprot:8415019-Pyramimonas_sp.AAC.1